MQHDAYLEHFIQQERVRQERTLNLIASENICSPAVRKATGSVLQHKYAEGLAGKRYYAGCEIIDQIESYAIERAKKLFGASWVNVQPHAGSQANFAVLFSLLKPGDKVLGFHLSHGGHLTHGSSVNFSGQLFQPSFYGVKAEGGRINMEEVVQVAEKERPKMIICGASSYSRDWDYAAFRKVADSVGALLLGDIAHPAGLIATGRLNNPFPHCHIVTTTTHKTLRGPRGGMIMIGEDRENPFGLKDKKGRFKMLSTLLDSGVFPGTQGGPHVNNIAAKAIAFHEALHPSFATYTEKLQKNTALLAKELSRKGYELVSGGTDNHLFLVDLRKQGISGKQAEETLAQAEITVNKNMVPFDDKSPYITSGIRIGMPTLTTRGVTSLQIRQIADWIDTLLKNPENTALITKIKQSVNAMAASLPLFVEEE